MQTAARFRLGLIAVLLACVAAPAWADSCTPSLGHPPLARKGKLIAAINPTVAPLQYIDDDGNMGGLDVDLGNAIAARLCLEMQWQSTLFATMIPLLKEGRIDLIDSFLAYTPARAEQVLLVPYGASTSATIVATKNADEVKELAYFSGRRLATELGTVDYDQAKAASDELAKAGKPPIDIRTFSTYVDVAQAVAAGQVEGGVIPTEQAFWYHGKNPNFFRIAMISRASGAEALAFKDPELAAAVVKVMNDMKQDGSFDKIFAPYGHCVLPGPYKVTTGPLPEPNCPMPKP
jgi:polar amino acid transport system substrate-binding protein